MSKKIKNTPSPDILMNSMRSIGYNFKTALADILDNSISANAKNIYISSPINDDNYFITILDDGDGMSDEELFNAMKYGSRKEFYGEKDLGRFGLGLKSASLSQCRILTVASKKENVINAYQWNLDKVIENKEWNCLKLDDDEIDEIVNIDTLKDIEKGTLVVWENFDIGFKKYNGRVRDYLSDEVELAENHIRLIFHRFLSNSFRNLKIFINNRLLEPIDPFLESNSKTDSQNVKEFNVNDSIIKIQPYVFPHQNDLSKEDIDKLGGIDALKNGQGFYIYRNERLIIYGTWFKLSSNNIDNELYKYGRIKVDIPNSLDELWEIDVKKQNAVIPKQILNNLKKVVSDICGRSKEKSSKRTKLTKEKDDSKIWNKKMSRDNKDVFYINGDSNFIKNFLNEFNDNDKNKILRLLDVISSSIPFDDIYNSICNKNNENKLSDEEIESIVLLGVSQFDYLKKYLQIDNEKIKDLLFRNEPFKDEIIKNKIMEIIDNDR